MEDSQSEEERDIPSKVSHGQLALRKKFVSMCERIITEENLKEPDEHADDEDHLNMGTHMFSSLESCMQQCDYANASEILKYLYENDQCSNQFVWKMVITIMNKDPAFYSSQFSNLCRALMDARLIDNNEIHLVKTVHLLEKKMYKEALEECRKWKELRGSTEDKPAAVVATSYLLTIYKTILDYQNIAPGDIDSLTTMKETFEILVNKKAYVPMFADCYTFVLMQLGYQKKAEEFILNYVESQGAMAAEHAFDIVKLHIPKVSQRVVLHLLETIAGTSPSHPKVLDLCKQHLYAYSSRTREHSDTESNLDFESDEGSDMATNHDSLNKCLKLITCFMDSYVNSGGLPTPLIREGWSIMSDTMRRVCLKGEDDCLQTIVDLWHNDRKNWWICFDAKHLPTEIPSGDATLYSNMGMVCYVLESQKHPFVVNLLTMCDCSLLKSLIRQLHRPKTDIDARVQNIISSTEPVKRVPRPKLKDYAKLHSTEFNSLMTPCSSRFEARDPQKLAEEFQEFIATTRPVRKKEEYKTTANIRPNTVETIQLPICDLLAKRYQKRKKVKPRSSRASSVCSFSSLDSSFSNLSDFDSVYTDDGNEDGTIKNDPVEKPGCSEWLHSQEKPSGILLDDLGLPTPSPIDCKSSENPTENHVIEKQELRWKDFVVNGHWKTTEEDSEIDDDDNFDVEDCSSDSDEYFPNDSSSVDSDFDDESLTTSEVSLTNVLVDEPKQVRGSYRSSSHASYATISSTSSMLSMYTPTLEFCNVLPQPTESIPNAEPYNFFDELSVCSSPTKEISNSITRALSSLDGDQQLPEQTHLETTFVKDIGPHGIYFDTEEYVVEETIPESSTLIPDKSFSRDFECSSPDIFVTASENDGSDSDIDETDVQAKTSSPTETEPPLAVSSPLTTRSEVNTESVKSDARHKQGTHAILAIPFLTPKNKKRKALHKKKSPSKVKSSKKRERSTSDAAISSRTKKAKKKLKRRTFELEGWLVNELPQDTPTPLPVEETPKSKKNKLNPAKNAPSPTPVVVLDEPLSCTNTKKSNKKSIDRNRLNTQEDEALKTPECVKSPPKKTKKIPSSPLYVQNESAHLDTNSKTSKKDKNPEIPSSSQENVIQEVTEKTQKSKKVSHQKTKKTTSSSFVNTEVMLSTGKSLDKSSQQSAALSYVKDTPKTTDSSVKKDRPHKGKKLLSSIVEEKELVTASVVSSVKLDDAVIGKSRARKTHTREKNPEYWSQSEDESCNYLEEEKLDIPSDSSSSPATPREKSKKRPRSQAAVKKSIEDEPVANTPTTKTTNTISKKSSGKNKSLKKKSGSSKIPSTVDVFAQIYKERMGVSPDSDSDSPPTPPPSKKAKKRSSSQVEETESNADEPVASSAETKSTKRISKKSSGKNKSLKENSRSSSKIPSNEDIVNQVYKEVLGVSPKSDSDSSSSPTPKEESTKQPKSQAAKKKSYADEPVASTSKAKSTNKISMKSSGKKKIANAKSSFAAPDEDEVQLEASSIVDLVLEEWGFSSDSNSSSKQPPPRKKTKVMSSSRTQEKKPKKKSK